MMKKMIPGILAVTVIAVGLLYFSISLLSGKGTYYYSQIDNRKIEEGDPREGVIDLQGGMAYYYTLPAYSKSGKEKEITFGTSRELREGAYIRLTVLPIRGVLEWCEVQYEELPAAVQAVYSN